MKMSCDISTVFMQFKYIQILDLAAHLYKIVELYRKV